METTIPKHIGRYEIKRLLGEGGMGNVYLAADPRLHREVAIKVMHTHYAMKPDFRQRFLQEAETAARLRHSGIVTVHDAGEDGDLLYIVMGYIRGPNLSQMLKEMKEAHKWLPLAEGVGIVRSLCSAVDYAHQHGVLHRDLKPGNIMIEPEPAEGLPYHPILADLGLAKLVEGGMETETGTTMGTPAYMSPEQALGEPVDARSDVYSLGILLYELCAGKLPFVIRTISEAIRCHTKETPPPPRTVNGNIPGELERIILNALEKNPANRYQNAMAFADALKSMDITKTITSAGSTLIAPPDVEPVSLWTQYQASLMAAPDSSINQKFADIPGKVEKDLIDIIGHNRPLRQELWRGNKITIGRGPENDIVIDDLKVSHKHLQIEFDGEKYLVTDLNSRNGSLLEGQRILPGSPEVLKPKAVIRIGDHWLRLNLVSKDIVQPTSHPLVEKESTGENIQPMQQGVINAVMEPGQRVVEAGGRISIPLILVNQGSKIDHFTVTQQGIPESWVSLPGVVKLFPNEKKDVEIVIQPPRTPHSKAGRHLVTFAISSVQEQKLTVDLPSEITINPFSEFSAELSPQSLRAGQTGRLTISNRGNAPERFEVSWADKAEELIFTPPNKSVVIPEGKSATIEFSAAPKQKRWIGGQQNYSINTQVTGSKIAQQSIAGEVVSRATIPSWLLPAIASIITMICIVLWPWLTQPKIRKVFSEPPNPYANQPITIHWQVDKAQTIKINGISVPAIQGEYIFENGFANTTTIKIVASNPFSSVEEEYTINVSIPEALLPTIEIWEIKPSQILVGEQVTLTWQVSNAESVEIQPLGTQELSGTLTELLQVNKTYTLIARNRDKVVTKSIEIIVSTPVPDAPVITSFTIDPVIVIRGITKTITVNWEVKNADVITITPSNGFSSPILSLDNQSIPAPETNTSYRIVAKGPGGEVTSTVNVTIEDPLCEVISGSIPLQYGPGDIYPMIQKINNQTKLAAIEFSFGFPDREDWIQVKLIGASEKGWVRAESIQCNMDPRFLPAIQSMPEITCTLFVISNPAKNLRFDCSSDNVYWPGGAVLNFQSKAAPATTVYNNKLYAVYIANNQSNDLQVIFYPDKGNWSDSRKVGIQSSKMAPAITAFNDKLCIVYVANNPTNDLLITCSSDGVNWSGSKRVGIQSSKSPAITVFNDELCIVYIANNPSNDLLLTCSLDSVNWTNSNRVGTHSSKTAPSLIVFNQKLYVVYVANNSTNLLLVTSSPDGANWSGNAGVGIQSSKSAPVATVFDNKLCIAYIANNDTNTILLSCSTDGLYWSDGVGIGNGTSEFNPSIIGFIPPIP